MGEVEHRDALGPKVESLAQRFLERPQRLKWQAINQIHIDAFEVERFRPAQHLQGHFFRLDSIHRLLHAFIEVLNPDAHAVEADVSQRPKMFLCQLPRIYLDTHLRFGINVERRLNELSHVANLVG